MNNRGTFNGRRNEARGAAQFAGIVARNSNGRPSQVTVPGHGGKRYDVLIKREGGVFVTECRIDTGVTGMISCPGSKYVCYHALAVVMAVAEDAGMQAVMCHSADDAAKVRNLRGGAVIQVINKAGTDKVWAVAFEPEAVKEDRPMDSVGIHA